MQSISQLVLASLLHYSTFLSPSLISKLSKIIPIFFCLHKHDVGIEAQGGRIGACQNHSVHKFFKFSEGRFFATLLPTEILLKILKNDKLLRKQTGVIRGLLITESIGTVSDKLITLDTIKFVPCFSWNSCHSSKSKAVTIRVV